MPSHGTVVKVQFGGSYREYVWLAALRRWARYRKVKYYFLLAELISDRMLRRRGQLYVVYDPDIGELGVA